MALLHRFVKLHDRGNTHVFSFVVTRSVTRDLHRDVTSKELTYGYQRWAITFSRTDKLLGVYLVWRNPCDGMRVYIDFTFTILNREHFSVNEAFTGKQVKFTFDSPAQGNRRLITMDDLYSRNFTDENGEFQLELTVANIRTVFETELRLPAAANGTMSPRKEIKLESPYFHFGHYDWHVAVSSATGLQGRPSVTLRRLTGFDHQCRVRYLVVLGESEKRADSGILDQLSDQEGRTPGWTCTRNRMQDLVQKGQLRLYFEMILANTTSEVKLLPVAQHVTPVQCYDRDKQAWALEPDLHSDMLRFRIVYNAIHNVPRNHLRYVCWNAYLLRRASRGLVDSVCLSNGPFSNYYAQESSDDGIIMESAIPVSEVREGTSEYVDERKEVTLQVEWVESLLLFQSTYSKYDDVTRMHNFQMRKCHGHFNADVQQPPSSSSSSSVAGGRPGGNITKLSVQGGVKGSRSPQPQRPTHLLTPTATLPRSTSSIKSASASPSCATSPQNSPGTTAGNTKRREICSLEAENYSLERQLFSYQKSIAYAQSRASSYVDDSRSNYPDESHPNYPEETTRTEYPEAVQEPHANYYLRPAPDAAGYQTPSLAYQAEHPAEYRPTTPSYQPEVSHYQAGVYTNGKRDFEARDYPAVAGKPGFENRDFANGGKKELDTREFPNTKRDFAARDYSPRDFAYEGYDRNFPSDTDYA